MFKKLICIALILIAVLSMGACSDTKYIDGVTYDTYGFINADDNKNPDIKYEIVIGNVVWSALLFPIGAVYFFGFDLYEPVGKKAPNAVKGQK